MADERKDLPHGLPPGISRDIDQAKAERVAEWLGDGTFPQEQKEAALAVMLDLQAEELEDGGTIDLEEAIEDAEAYLESGPPDVES